MDPVIGGVPVKDFEEWDVKMGLLLSKMTYLARQMEKFNYNEYANYLSSPSRFIFVNFLGGLIRGFGIALGATIMAALALYILQRIVVLNLPVIGDFLAELVRIVLTYL